LVTSSEIEETSRPDLLDDVDDLIPTPGSSTSQSGEISEHAPLIQLLIHVPPPPLVSVNWLACEGASITGNRVQNSLLSVYQNLDRNRKAWRS